MFHQSLGVAATQPLPCTYCATTMRFYASDVYTQTYQLYGIGLTLCLTGVSWVWNNLPLRSACCTMASHKHHLPLMFFTFKLPYGTATGLPTFVSKTLDIACMVHRSYWLIHQVMLYAFITNIDRFPSHYVNSIERIFWPDCFAPCNMSLSFRLSVSPVRYDNPPPIAGIC